MPATIVEPSCIRHNWSMSSFESTSLQRTLVTLTFLHVKTSPRIRGSKETFASRISTPNETSVRPLYRHSGFRFPFLFLSLPSLSFCLSVHLCPSLSIFLSVCERNHRCRTQNPSISLSIHQIETLRSQDHNTLFHYYFFVFQRNGCVHLKSLTPPPLSLLYHSCAMPAQERHD